MASISSGDKRHPSTSVRVRLRGSDVTFPLHTKSSWFPAVRRVAVRAARNLEMPARTEHEVMARLDTPEIEGGTWIVEDSSETENTVMVACAIVQPKSRMIPVRLVNCTSETLTIYADKQIALAEVATDTGIGSVDDPKEDSISRRGVLTREKEEILWGLVESADAGLSLEKKEVLHQLLVSYANEIAQSPTDTGQTDWLEHTIDTGTATPIRQSIRQISPQRRDEVCSLLQDMYAMALWNTLAVLGPHRVRFSTKETTMLVLFHRPHANVQQGKGKKYNSLNRLATIDAYLRIPRATVNYD